MAVTTVKTIFQFRRDTNANWLANKDVIPAAGEPCFDLDLHTLKIGDGKTTYENLPAMGGVNAEIGADGKSIVFEDNTFKLLGFDAAEVGAQPRIGANGLLEWVVPSTETVDGLRDTVASMQSNMTTIQNSITNIQEIINPSTEGATPLLSRVETLEDKMDGTGEGTVDAKIDAKINEFAQRISDDGTINTLQELVSYVATHGSEVSSITADISSLKGLVGNKSVAEQIAAAGYISKTDAEETFLSKEQAAATLKHVEYEVSDKPAGTMVDYRDDEIRIMCPADTKWALQNGGSGADASLYYIGFKAYAPVNAVSFKEDLAEIISDATMYSFENNAFAGVDKFGRKYSIVWLPVAKHDVDTGAWSYYGAQSTSSKYIGWYYSVEWYDVDGKKIAADTVRINLSNESCYSNAEPYYMASTVKTVSVGGTILEVVDGKVEIPAGAGLKSSQEVIVNEDGTLSIGTIGFDKLVVGDGEIVFDGGGAAG